MQWKNYSYDLTEEGAVLTQYLSETSGSGGILETDWDYDEGDLVIPSEIEGHPVVEIGADAFSENGAMIRRVEVPASVKRIANGAFRMCMSLTELILHEGLEEIGEDVFYLTPIAEISLPSTVERIGRSWELGSIQWKISDENPYYFSDGYGLYRKDKSEQELLVVCAQDERKEYTVVSKTTAIAESAFSGNSYLEKIELLPGVTTIRTAAMESCQSLAEVILPEGLCEIQAYAFSHCIRLKEIHLPASLEKLGLEALSDTFGWSDSLNGLEMITTEPWNPHFEADENALFEREPDGSRSIVKYFGRQREYRIPSDVSRIQTSAFRRAELRKFYVPKGLRDFDADAFRECKNLEEIYLEESDTTLYVPRQPVYRKDEITALFFSSMRVYDRDAEVSMDDLPEKWQSFAGNAIYSKSEEPEYDPYEQYVFDYRGYDALFHTYLNLPDHLGMACCRLKYPVMLHESVKEKYEAFLWDNLSDIWSELAGRQDMYHLAILAELGFFTAQNTEAAIELFSARGQTKFVSYLLNYKRENLGGAEFDFSL